MPLLPVLGRQISVSLRSVWSTWQVPGQTEIHTETLSERKKKLNSDKMRELIFARELIPLVSTKAPNTQI